MTTHMSNVIPGSNSSSGGAVMHYQCAGAPVAAVNDVQTITVGGAPTHSTLTVGNLPNGLAAYTAAQDITPAALTTARNALLGAGSVTVTGTYSAGSGGTYIFTWGANFAGLPVPVLTVSATFVGGTNPSAANVHTTTGVAATYRGVTPPGSLLVDVTNTQLYINTGTQLVPVWAQIAHA